MLVGVRRIHEQFEISFILIECETFDFAVPRFEYLLTSEVVEVIEYREGGRERNTLEEIFHH